MFFLILISVFFLPAVLGATTGAYYDNHWVSALGTATLILSVQVLTARKQEGEEE